MSVINPINSSKKEGGSGETAAARKVPFYLVHQDTTSDMAFRSWDLTKPHYVSSIEVMPLNGSGAVDITSSLELRLYKMMLDSKETWYDNKGDNTREGRIFKIAEIFGDSAVRCDTKIYLEASRLDGLTFGLRVVVRGYTLEI